MEKPSYRQVILPQGLESVSSEPIEQIIYLLDDENRIVNVSGSWMEFARANEGSVLGMSQVLNRPIWQFIIGEETRDIYFQLLRHVRDTGQMIEFPYRCDSPNCRRYMRMRLEPVEDQQVRFINQVMQVTPIEMAYVPTARAYSGMINRCSICTQVQLGDEWVEMAYAAEQGLLDRDTRLLYLYLVCDECKSRLQQLLDEQMAGCRRAISRV